MSFLKMVENKDYISLKKFCEDRVSNILFSKIKDSKDSILQNLREEKDSKDEKNV